jgi:hypothetical protein
MKKNNLIKKFKKHESSDFTNSKMIKSLKEIKWLASAPKS